MGVCYVSFILMRKRKVSLQLGRELVHHLKPTLPEVDRGLIALICITTVPLSLTFSVLEAATILVGAPLDSYSNFISTVKRIHPELLFSCLLHMRM